MLQDSKTREVVDEISAVAPQEEGTADFVYWAIGVLRRQYLVILFVAALVVCAAFIYLGVATPIYTAQTNVYIDLHKNPIDQQQQVFGNDPIEIESQIQIIKSKAVASSVIKKLQLMNDPDFHASTSAFWASLFGAKPVSDSDPIENMSEAFEGGLTVEPAGGRVVAIKYNSKSPVQAAQIANAVANAYITDQLEAKYQANRVAANWLLERQQQLGEQADAAQRAVEIVQETK